MCRRQRPRPRLRGLIVVLWRAGLQICEALALALAESYRTRVTARCWCAARTRPRETAAAGVRRRFAPHQLRHAHAVESSPNPVGD